MNTSRALAGFVGMIALAEWGDDGPGSEAGLSVTEIAAGFDGPTQIARLPHG